MLNSLRLRNIATISDTALELGEGLNVLTGETGAGKSILVDGLLLALGERADHSLVRPGEKVASVEAVFEISGLETTVRREVHSAGRSRLFIDDELTDLETARERVGALVDLHTQRSTPALLSRRTQQAALDAFAGCAPTATRVSDLHRTLGRMRAEMRRMEERLGRESSRMELLSHEASLISGLGPSRDEYTELMERRASIESDRSRIEALSALDALLSGEDGGLVRSLREHRTAIGKAGGPRDLEAMLAEAEIALKEAASTCSSALASTDGAQWSASEIDRRLDEYGRVLGRYGGDIERLLERSRELGAELASLAGLQEEHEKLSRQAGEVLLGLGDSAGVLTAARERARADFGDRVTGELHRLGMEGAVFGVRFDPAPPDRSAETPSGPVSSDGAELVEFEFSANPGMPPGPVSSVPSGGELSRLSLAVRLALSGSGPWSTLVFDEIDSGVGGTTARLLAESLRRASEGRQTIVITHLPQIASRAARHLAVVKAGDGAGVVTSVLRLEGTDREAEIARMLGGGEAALDHARALLGGGNR